MSTPVPAAARRAYTAEQVRRAEQPLLDSQPEGLLMQRAAGGLAASCALYLGGVYGRRVLVLAGSGANGGDALHAAARLAVRGARVEAVLLRPDRVHPGGLAAFRAAGGTVVDAPPAVGGGSPPDLVLDGIVGLGGTPGLRGDAVAAWRAVEDLGCPVIAVDVPSGVGVDDGGIDGPCVRADLTVTFGALKIGLLVGAGARAAGAVHLVDIGLGPHLGAPPVVSLTADAVAELLAPTVPGPSDHKYTRGVVGVAAGSSEFTGAGLLAVAGACCGLAGMVRYTGPAAVADLVRGRHPEVVVGAGQVQATVVGSGGGGEAGSALGRARRDGVPLVVDADALGHLDGPVGGPAVLTPHAGELARMLGRERAQVEADPLGAASEAADRYAAVVLLKGDRTVVVPPRDGGRRGPVYVNGTGTPWLGTAGTGDVLAGLCGTLLAAGLPPVHAGAVGAWLHGAAGRSARRHGPVVASAVAAALPGVIGRLLDGADG